MTKLPFCLQPSKPSDNNDYESYKKGEFELEEWEDVNYCEHSFSYGDKGLTDREVVDLLNELHEENQYLEHYHDEVLKCLHKTDEDYKEQINKLQEENQQLKEKLRKIEEITHNLKEE